MNFDLLSLSCPDIQLQSRQEILSCNAYSAQFGLMLTPEQAAELADTRNVSLKATGRLEFGGSAVRSLIQRFCDSPYLTKETYTQTLHALIEIFYHYKNVTLDLISDDDLLSFMKSAYDGVCQGSLELLSERELDRLAGNLLSGRPADANDNAPEDMEEDGEDKDAF